MASDRMHGGGGGAGWRCCDSEASAHLPEAVEAQGGQGQTPATQ